jgi:hypothetical protein
MPMLPTQNDVEAGAAADEDRRPTVLAAPAQPPEAHRQARPGSTIAVPRIVQHTPRGRAWKLAALEPDPEADARVAAFFAKMIRPRD